MATEEDYKKVGMKLGIIFTSVIGGCALAIVIALAVKVILWMFGL